MRQQRSRTSAVEVGEAKAFVEAMEAIDAFKLLERNWNGDGSRPPRAQAMGAAARMLKDRQAMASRMKVEAGVEGDIRIHFRCGVAGDGDPGHVHIDAAGKPAIMVGEDKDEANAPRYVGVSSKDFRKKLDDIVSPRIGKYGAKKYEIDGILFDSAQEAKRYGILKSDLKTGLIADLRMQVPYLFEENGRKCFIYKSDFNYTVVATGVEMVEDVKGMPTDVYKLKKKLIEARFGIEITEWPVTRKELERRAKVAERDRRAAEKTQRTEERALAAERRRAEQADKQAKPRTRKAKVAE